MIGIYKITSPTNKIYIGQSVNIEIRKNQYKNFYNFKTSIGPKLYNSLQKYGFDQHKFEIIEECSIEELNEKEIFWKLFYNSVKDGLNCELYDKGGGPRSEETKKKMIESRKGKPTKLKGYKRPQKFSINLINNIERGRKISQSNINKKANRGSKKGRILSLDAKLKISKNSRGISRNKGFKQSKEHIEKLNKFRYKSILQYDLEDNFIREWESIIDASKNLNINRRSISNNLNNISKTAGNFKWKYKIN